MCQLYGIHKGIGFEYWIIHIRAFAVVQPIHEENKQDFVTIG